MKKQQTFWRSKKIQVKFLENWNHKFRATKEFIACHKKDQFEAIRYKIP